MRWNVKNILKHNFLRNSTRTTVYLVFIYVQIHNFKPHKNLQCRQLQQIQQLYNWKYIYEMKKKSKWIMHIQHSLKNYNKYFSWKDSICRIKFIKLCTYVDLLLLSAFVRLKRYNVLYSKIALKSIFFFRGFIKFFFCCELIFWIEWNKT